MFYGMYSCMIHCELYLLSFSLGHKRAVTRGKNILTVYFFMHQHFFSSLILFFYWIVGKEQESGWNLFVVYVFNMCILCQSHWMFEFSYDNGLVRITFLEMKGIPSSFVQIYFVFLRLITISKKLLNLLKLNKAYILFKYLI